MKDDDFFSEKPVIINFDDGESFTVFMRPVKLKDIPTLNRIIYLQEIDTEDEQAASMLIGLMVSTLNMSGDEIPIEAATDLITYFLELNFPKDETELSEDELLGEKLKPKKGIADCIDFLARQGHSYTDILEFTIPQFKKIIQITAERLGVKKETMDPAAAFRKLGISIKPRSELK